MSEWTAGYVADLTYTHGYYVELNPLRLQLAFLDMGLVAPKVGVACELGIGQGVSANMHASASIVQWVGNDFNPAQIAFAQELADACDSGVQLCEDSFAEFAARTDLPDFDYIALHGIWSWVSDENRHVLVDFIRRKLKVGGVLYISYNALPGWSNFASMRHLMMQHVESYSGPAQGHPSRIDAALNFATGLLATEPNYARVHTQVGERVERMKSQPKAYLAHEYFNRDWEPMHFSTMAKWMADAKLQFACSATLLEHVDPINLSAEQLEYLGQFADPDFRESVRDFMVNQQFRRDYWVKGRRQLPPREQHELLRQLRFILTTPASEVTLKVKGTYIEADMNANVYGPLLQLLSDFSVRSLGEIEAGLSGNGITFDQIIQALLILVGQGHLYLVQGDDDIAAAKEPCGRLNRHLMNQARSVDNVVFLSSPVIGGGFPVNRFQQLFLLAQCEGLSVPEEWAQFVWQILSVEGRHLLVEGKELKTAEENLRELVAQAQRFGELKLPVLKALQLC